jgi:hypothetical protein
MEPAPGGCEWRDTDGVRALMGGRYGYNDITNYRKKSENVNRFLVKMWELFFEDQAPFNLEGGERSLFHRNGAWCMMIL